APERCELERRFVGAVAVRAVAVDDEELVPRELLERPLRDAAVRKVEGSLQVAAAEVLGTAHVEKHEAGRARLERGMDVLAVGLELQQAREVLPRFGGRQGGDFGSGRSRGQRRHVNLLLPMESASGRASARLADLPSFGNTMPMPPSSLWVSV